MGNTTISNIRGFFFKKKFLRYYLFLFPSYDASVTSGYLFVISHDDTVTLLFICATIEKINYQLINNYKKSIYLCENSIQNTIPISTLISRHSLTKIYIIIIKFFN